MENNENNEVFAAKILKTLEKHNDKTTSRQCKIFYGIKQDLYNILPT